MRSTQTIAEYHQWLRRFNGWGGEHFPTLQAKLLAFLASLTPPRARSARCALKATLNGQITTWADVPTIRYQRDEPTLRQSVLTAEEIRRCAQLPVDRRALVACCYVLRRCEVARLAWGDVDLEHGVVTVRHGKGDRPGTTVLPPAALLTVRAWHAQQGGVDLAAPVFPRRGGKYAHVETISRWVAEALDAIGLSKTWRGPHAFRRTFATVFLRTHPDQLRRLQVLMRHANISTTVQYDWPTPQDLREAVKELPL